MKKGLIHLYTGDGKGKTTAALGLLLRAYGCGMKTVFVQFLKGSDSGEIKALEDLGNITVLRQTEDFGFYNSANEQSKMEIRKQNNENLTEAYRLLNAGLCDLLVLDEICAAYANNVVNPELLDKLINEKPSSVEIVLTGRNAPQHFIERADYVTEFIKQKHPFDKGIAARKGIEF